MTVEDDIRQRFRPAPETRRHLKNEEVQFQHCCDCLLSTLSELQEHRLHDHETYGQARMYMRRISDHMENMGHLLMIQQGLESPNVVEAIKSGIIALGDLVLSREIVGKVQNRQEEQEGK